MRHVVIELRAFAIAALPGAAVTNRSIAEPLAAVDTLEHDTVGRRPAVDTIDSLVGFTSEAESARDTAQRIHRSSRQLNRIEIWRISHRMRRPRPMKAT